MLVESCRALGIEPAVERSRSGDGAHVWFFFSDAVPAVQARMLGFSILTRTMSGGAGVGVASYDRLFPSQDVLPAGGFGNLIAPPLQLIARRRGNTEFLDDGLEPYPDQWSYLASVPRITPDRLAELVSDCEGDRALAVRPAPGERDAPWRRSPTLRQQPSHTPLPRSVAATIADRLYVDRVALPPALTHAVRRLASFSNPEFLELQRVRRQVGLTPRVIGCFDELDRYIALPRGCLPDVEALFAELSIQLMLTDERVDGNVIEVGFRGGLTSSQRAAAEALQRHEIGLLCAPPGWGKTVVATSLIASRGRATLILVNRQHLVEQWANRLAEFLDSRRSRSGDSGVGAGVSPGGSMSRCFRLSRAARTCAT